MQKKRAGDYQIGGILTCIVIDHHVQRTMVIVKDIVKSPDDCLGDLLRLLYLNEVPTALRGIADVGNDCVKLPERAVFSPSLDSFHLLFKLYIVLPTAGIFAKSLQLGGRRAFEEGFGGEVDDVTEAAEKGSLVKKYCQ